MDINLFKFSYKSVRETGGEIYKGFGFKHLSNATQFYVHPNNESSAGKTSLCQSIGESLILFSSLLQSIEQGTGFGDCYVSNDGQSFFLSFEVPADYRENGVVPLNVLQYRALCWGNTVKVAAYDTSDRWMVSDGEDLNSLYKLLPIFMVLLARERENNGDYRALLDRFVAEPAVDLFVNLHEDFYQNHKNEKSTVEYTDLFDFDLDGFYSFSQRSAVVHENKANMERREKEVPIIPFDSSSFSDDALRYVPKLSDEFVLPKRLRHLCNAIAAGDVFSVLLHGPAGTGKTISCKLICQATGLPLLETINCTENLDEFVLGKYIPQEDKIIFKESYVTEAIRGGGAVVFEEINFAKPQYLAFLNSLLDDNGFVRLDNGEVVKRHPNFRFFATMNMGYFGTKELNQALYNRFHAVIEVAALSDAAISRMLLARVPECKDVVDKILGVYHKIKKKIENEELDVVLSPRNLENWARLAKYEGYLKAAEETMVPVARCDRTLEETIRGIIMLYKWG